jgi:hypothetical protein
LKSGSLKLLEPSGPIQVCTGIALPFTKRDMRDISLRKKGFINIDLRETKGHSTNLVEQAAGSWNLPTLTLDTLTTNLKFIRKMEHVYSCQQ